MQKRKFIPLATLLLCSLCLSACGKTTTSHILATINGNHITAENVYDNSLYDKDIAEYYYGILEKALIQSTIPVNNSMETTVNSEVDNWVEKIKADAQLNGTDYKEDLKKKLEEEKVNSVEELKNKKIYNLQKEAAKTMFLKAYKDKYSDLFVKENYLYHIGNIQFSISSGENDITDYYGATTSVEQMKDLYKAIKELVQGEMFYNVALQYSSAESKNQGGDEGIVTLKDADITNQLRYSLMGYSSLIEKKFNELSTQFQFPTVQENKDSLYITNLYGKDAGIETIPFEYFEGLKDNYDTSECYNDIKDTVYTNSKVYYRNILFNALLNTKSPRFITLTADQVEKYHAQDSVIDAKTLGVKVLVPNVNEHGFKESENQETYILSNKEGKPYMLFRDANGLHIINIVMTPFDENYSRYFSNKFDTNDDFISYAETDKEGTSRKEEVDKFADRYITQDFGDETANEKLLDFEIFKFLLTKNKNFKIVNSQIKSMIDQYMNSTKVLNDLKTKNTNSDYYDDFANNVKTAKDIVVNEIPLLSCLNKDKNGKRMCVYEYGKGFSFYDSESKGSDK